MPRRLPRLVIETLECRDVPAAFTPGDVVIYRTGDGTTTLGSTGNAVFLDEYSPTGTLVQSISMPTTVSGANKQLIAVGNATAEGLMTRSADGGYLLLGGYAANLGGSTGLAGSSPATIPRTIGRVGADGSVDTSLALNDLPAGAGAVRGVASVDGNQVWVSTTSSGVWYAPYSPGATSTQMSTTVTTMRYVNVFNGQLYTSENSGSFRLSTVGTGLPTTSGQTVTNLPGFPTTGSPYGFFFADLDAGVPGVDTLYYADDTNTDGVGGIWKYSLVGGTWTSNGHVGTFSDAYRGLTGTVTGTSVTLFATRKGSELVSLVDSSGYNGALTAAPSAALATAGTNKAFRGVAMAPVFDAAPVNTVQNQTTNEDVPISLAGLGVADPDAGSADIQVKFSVPAGLATFDVLTNISGGVTAGQVTGNDTNSVTLTAPLAAINATIQSTPFGSGIAFLPAANVNGDVTITMTTSDLGHTGFGGPLTDTDPFTLTVFAVNDAPVNTVPGAQTVNEDTDLVFSAANSNAISVSDVDAGTAPVQVTLTATHGVLTLGGTTNLTVTGNGSGTVVATGALGDLNAGLTGLKFTPDSNYNGSASLQIVTNDQGNTGSGGALSDTDTVAITVNAVNDAPVVNPASFIVNQNAANGTVVGTVTASDVEGDSFTFAITGGNTGGAFAIDPNTGQITVATAAAVIGGPFSLTVTATDNGTPNASGSATVSVTLNTPPTVSQPIGDRTVFEDAPPIVIDLGPVFADAEDPDSALTFTVSGNSDPSLFTSVAISGATLTVTFAPDANGFSAVTVRATDTRGLFVENAFVATATAVNDAPTLASIGNVTVDEDATPQTVNLSGITAGPANESAQTLSIVATSDNPGLIPDPVVTYGGGTTATLKYTPVADANGTATVTVTVTDNGGTANGGVNVVTRTFTVTVNAVNDPPTLDPIANVITDEDSGQQSVNLTGISAGPANESGQTLTFTAVSDNPALIPNPVVTYTGGAT
ncbi:MAG: cadherin domain-containing protein, partial [Zavarzinella sp.]|nr:cadherin domain-containing protein [Zavarzinella sp.]